jgi:predicted Zn-dependent protease
MAVVAEGSAFPTNRKTKRSAAVLIALLLGFCVSGTRVAASEPKPTRPFYNRFSSEDEAKLGSALALKIETDGIPVASGNGEQITIRIKRDLALETYLESIAAKLSHSSQRPEINYSVRLLDAPGVVNAFSIPGGHIYVSSGLLDFVQSESELAAVLGHEIGHVVARHAINRIARVNLFSLLVGQARDIGLISDEATAQKLADFAMPLLFAIDARTFYSRDDEIEADLLSFYELSRAGWNPEGEIALLARLAKAAPEESPLDAVMATHPNSSDRLLVVQNEYNVAGLSVTLKGNSPEFEAMKHTLHKIDDNRPSAQPITLVVTALGLGAALLLALVFRSRKQQPA